MASLCEDFRLLAYDTWGRLGRARRVGHQLLEESFTDFNLLELRDRHSAQVYTRVFTKPQEGLNGADWEWWLTDSRRSEWLGLRIQAKVLELKSDSFSHLHYKSGRVYQATKLKRTCRRLGLIPLYCLYMHSSSPIPSKHSCRTFGRVDEAFGCSLLPVRHVERLRKSGGRNGLADVGKHCFPWHCLICCVGFGGSSLPQSAWAFLQRVLRLRDSPRRSDDFIPVGVRSRPPSYVREVFEGGPKENPDPALRGITVLVGTEDRQG